MRKRKVRFWKAKWTFKLTNIEAQGPGAASEFREISWLDDITDSMDKFEQTRGGIEGQWSLACYSPWGRKESDMTDWLNNKNPVITYYWVPRKNIPGANEFSEGASWWMGDKQARQSLKGAEKTWLSNLAACWTSTGRFKNAYDWLPLAVGLI